MDEKCECRPDNCASCSMVWDDVKEGVGCRMYPCEVCGERTQLCYYDRFYYKRECKNGHEFLVLREDRPGRIT